MLVFSAADFEDFLEPVSYTHLDVYKRQGYNIYVVDDCCGATSPAAQEAALSRMVQAGAVRLTTIGALLEWQRDWKNKEHYNALMGLLKKQAGAYGIGVEYAYTMVHHAPQSAQVPQVVPKSAH